MTQTLALIVNAVGMVGLVGGLAAVVRLIHRVSGERRAETLHPSQPIELAVYRHQHDRSGLARTA